MAAPNMETITASIERSLQNCSLNQTQSSGTRTGRPAGSGESDAVGAVRSYTSGSGDHPNHHHNHHHHLPNSDTVLDLNSHISLPYQWEQCLDLKTGEIYYVNWMNGMKAKEDPRTNGDYSGDYYSEEEDEEDEDEDDSSYDSEECYSDDQFSQSPSTTEHHYDNKDDQQVLVVAGCKSCFMYFMVPKQLLHCPKCSGHLLHFDRTN